MDKLVKDIGQIISGTSLFNENHVPSSSSSFCISIRSQGRRDVICLLEKALRLYKVRHQRESKSFSMEISSGQFRLIRLMVDLASERQSIIDSLSYNAVGFSVAYFKGYISAVHRIMEILGIDENSVEK